MSTKSHPAPASAGFDLADLDIVAKGDEPQPLVLMDPRTNAPTGVTFYVLSSHSETMQAYDDEQANKAARRAKQLTAEDLRERGVSRSARLLMGAPWTGVVWKGQPLAHNLLNAKLLMTQLPWARVQVENFAAQEGAFLGNGSLPSSSSASGTSASASIPAAAS